jgi:hypothetical protein
LIAPPNTTFKTVELDKTLSHSTPSFLQWILSSGRGELARLLLDDGRPLPVPARVKYTVDSSFVSSFLFCPSLSNHVCSGGEFVVALANIEAVLDDEFSPIVATPALPSTVVRGTVDVSYGALDFGSGIANVALIVDGVERQTVHVSNGGRCAEKQPYQFLAPCAPEVSSAFPLDMTTLGEDQLHTVEVSVEDAAGQKTVSAPASFIVHNAPTNRSRPTLAGSAKVGEALIVQPGRWDGDPTAFSYQWLRCPPTAQATGDTAGCVLIEGASGRGYTPQAEDLKYRVVAAVTATNAFGSDSQFSLPSDIVGAKPKPHKPPVLSHVSLSRKRFRVGLGPASSGRGAVLRFSCSKPGHLSMVIERMRGKKASKKFPKLAAAIKAGPSAVLLTGEIGSKKLTPGKYRVTIRVKDDAGNASHPASVLFTILPG